MFGSDIYSRNKDTQRQLQILSSFDDELQPIDPRSKKKNKKKKLIGVDSEGNPMGLTDSNIAAGREWQQKMQDDLKIEDEIDEKKDDDIDVYRRLSKKSSMNYQNIPIPIGKRSGIYHTVHSFPDDPKLINFINKTTYNSNLQGNRKIYFDARKHLYPSNQIQHIEPILQKLNVI